MAITSGQVWDVPDAKADTTDRYVLGQPAHPEEREAFHLLQADVGRFVRSATAGFFDGRDSECSVPSTLGKIFGVVLALAGIVLVTLAVVGVLGLWTIKALIG